MAIDDWAARCYGGRIGAGPAPREEVITSQMPCVCVCVMLGQAGGRLGVLVVFYLDRSPVVSRLRWQGRIRLWPPSSSSSFLRAGRLPVHGPILAPQPTANQPTKSTQSEIPFFLLPRLGVVVS